MEFRKRLYLIIRLSKFILIYLAGFILFLHTVVPHSHAGDISMDEKPLSIETADSFLDFVKLAFLFDLGEGHMENFPSSDGPSDFSTDTGFIDIIAIAPILTEIYLIHELRTPNEFDIRQLLKPPEIHLLTPVLRGPPSHTIG